MKNNVNGRDNSGSVLPEWCIKVSKNIQFSFGSQFLKKYEVDIMIDVTIIMPTYNRETALEMTLVGFSKQTYLEFEIIIVNDGGNKEVKNIVDKYKNKLRIKYIYQKNMGRSVARNTALKCAKGKYIIFNDDDRIPAVDYVEKHRNLLKQNENNVIVGHKRDIINTNDSTLPKFEIIQNRISDLMIKKCQPTFSMFELQKKVNVKSYASR